MTNHTPEKWAAYSLKDTTGQWFVESEDEEICCLMGVNAKEHAQH